MSVDARSRALDLVQGQLAEAVAAAKCHGCGCLHKTVEAFAATQAGGDRLAEDLSRARAVFVEKKYDCLGCEVCYPAIAANAFGEAFPGVADAMDLCPTEAPAKRAGWPPLPGDYHLVRYRAPVAVCTLNDAGLAQRIAALAPERLAIVGTLHTENLGIERLIQNVRANPHIRYLIVCGEDTRQAIGHLPGQSLASLLVEGTDERGRIRGARGKRPVIANLRHDEVEALRRQVTLVERIGEQRDLEIVRAIEQCDDPGPAVEVAPDAGSVEVVRAAAPRRLVPDPAGFFVVYPDARNSRLVVEQFSNEGVLGCVIEGETPAAIYSAAIERRLVTRLDHAAYLGRELARAQRCMETGERYVQDRAPGELDADAAPSPCGCKATCGANGERT